MPLPEKEICGVRGKEALAAIKEKEYFFLNHKERLIHANNAK
jgi:hypothetical protein